MAEEQTSKSNRNAAERIIRGPQPGDAENRTAANLQGIGLALLAIHEELAAIRALLTPKASGGTAHTSELRV